MSLDDEKTRLRALARRRRAAANQAAGPGAGEALRDNFVDAMAAMGIPAGGPVAAGYVPIKGEMDVGILLSHLHGEGFVCALPVVGAPGATLEFRRWVPGAPLEKGKFGTRHPAPTEPGLRPDMVLAPLLAFDARGYRLGWGGGYYDRTIEALRDNGPLVVVGVAYAAQQVDTVPHSGRDQRLDWVVTEDGAVRVG
ncbi:MAG: 5-formyltetrahydrofolate cyclo-ligase [Rhodospirillales bacterium]